MNKSSNMLRKQRRVRESLECWISDIRQVELNLRTARDSEKYQAASWVFLAISPT